MFPRHPPCPGRQRVPQNRILNEKAFASRAAGFGMRPCSNCGGEFRIYHRGSETCSRRCYKALAYKTKNPKLEKSCGHCSAVFTPKASNKAIFCSPTCSKAAVRSRDRRCPVRLEAVRQRARRYSKTESYRIGQINHKARRRQVEKEGSITVQQWEDRLIEFGHQCAYCPASGVKLTMDHVIALSRGGKHHIDNVVPACSPCNSKKNNETWVPRCP